MNKFNVRKYQNENSTLVDGSDALANQRELVISFYHVPSERVVKFKAFITAFNESYSSNFTPHETFGRTDPIYQYKGTTRKITLAFKVPAASESEAFENLGRVSALEQMLYPTYSELNSATTLSQAPLIRVKVMNLLSAIPDYNKMQDDDRDSYFSGSGNPRNILYNSYNSLSNPKNGLLGVIDNLTVNHNLEGEDGVFFKRKEVEDPDTGRLVASPVNNTILPKFIDVNLSFSPIHEITLGWDNNKSQTNSLFPYGVITDQTQPLMLKSADLAQTSYNDKQEKIKADQQARKLKQQRIDNAKARYGGVLGELRFKRDKRLQSSDRSEAVRSRAMENINNAVFAEYLGADLGFDIDLGDQFITEYED